jgi:hypothetical protein
MPRSPVAQLVEAANSPNLEVALEAQLAIDNHLRTWQRDVDGGRRIGHVSAQLGALARSLADRHDAFSTVDHPWIERTTNSMLSLANRIPSRHSPTVARHCEIVLAALGAAAAASPPTTSVTSVAGGPPAAPNDFDTGFTRQAAHPWTAHPAIAASTPTSFRSRGSSQVVDLSVSATDQSFAAEALSPVGAPPGVGAVDLSRDTSPDRAAIFQWQPHWSHPMLSTLPATPISAPPARDAHVDRQRMNVNPRNEQESELAARNGGRQFRDVGSRSLLERWLVAEGADVEPLEQELTRRGFGRLSARLVRQLFSDRPDERLRLVDDVLTEPAVDARPWLLLLAHDTDPDVRLVVVTIMATSNDATLIEKAWQVAIRDRDPRIAGLAPRLRERRGDVQRR